MQDVLNTEADLNSARLKVRVLPAHLVMVGHSLGAFETLIYTDRHLDRVAGIVLVDPSTPDQEERFDKAAPTLRAYNAISAAPLFKKLRSCISALRLGLRQSPTECERLRPAYPEPLRRNLIAATNNASYWETYLSFLSSVKLEAKQVINPNRSYGNRPLIVLKSGLSGSTKGAPPEVIRQIPAFHAVAFADKVALSQLSTRGALVTALSAQMYLGGLRPC